MWGHADQEKNCPSPFEIAMANDKQFSSTGINHDDGAPMITMKLFTKGFYIVGFNFTPDRGNNKQHVSLPCQENERIMAQNTYQYPLLTLCMLNFPDTLKSTFPETLQYNEYHSDHDSCNQTLLLIYAKLTE